MTVSAVTQMVLLGERMLPSYSYIGHVTSGTNTGTYTFTAASLGTAANNRYIVIVAYGDVPSGTSFTSITVQGITATISVQANGTLQPNAIAIALVPTGTTGDVVVTFSTTQNRAGIDIYRLVDLASGTAFNTASAVNAAGSNPTVSLNIPYAGIAIGGAGTADGASWSWSGLTEDSDYELEAGGNVVSAASTRVTAAVSGQSITATTTTGARNALVAASFG